MTTVSASFGSRLGLETAFENGEHLLNTLGGYSLLDICKKSNVFNSVIYNKILSDGNKFLFTSPDDDFFLHMLNLDTFEGREVINNLFMDSDFSDGSSHQKKGNIIVDDTVFDKISRFLNGIARRSRIQVFETEQRLIAQKDLQKVFTTKRDNQDYVIF